MNRHIMRKELLALKDPENAAFVAKLTPEVDPGRILGLRAPQLRSLAKQIRREGKAEAFLNDLPHRYLEEDLIHAYLISDGKDYRSCMAWLEQFLPYADCWNTTDAIRPKVIARHTEETEPYLIRWMNSEKPYAVRTAIGLYMAYYLGDAFRPEQAERIADLRFDHYYVRMMAAWYMATALAKQPEAVMPLIRSGCMDVWTHNKTIQKACESFRVPQERKELLKTLKRKEER